MLWFISPICSMILGKLATFVFITKILQNDSVYITKVLESASLLNLNCA